MRDRIFSQKQVVKNSTATASEFSGQQIRCKQVGYTETNRYENSNRILVSGSKETCLPLVLVVYLLACTRLLLHFQTQKHLYLIIVAISHLPRKKTTIVRQDLAYVAIADFFFSKQVFLSILLFSCFSLSSPT